MTKNYSESSKQLAEQQPKKRTIDFILNYSKSTTIVNKGKFNFITFQN